MPKNIPLTYRKNAKKYGVNKCFVPSCENRNFKTKIFFLIPKDERRMIWFSIVEKELNKYDKYCCQDHFDLEDDCINWIAVNRNNSLHVKLKPNIVPHKKIQRKLNKLELCNGGIPASNNRLLSKNEEIVEDNEINDEMIVEISDDEENSERSVMCACGNSLQFDVSNVSWEPLISYFIKTIETQRETITELTEQIKTVKGV